MNDDDEDWLPPRRGIVGAHDFGDPTPETTPELNAVSPDDPAVTALVTPSPTPDALPPPDGDDDITPPPFYVPERLANREQARIIANADLVRAFADRHSDDDDAPSMRLRLLHVEQRLANLEAFIRDEFKRR